MIPSWFMLLAYISLALSYAYRRRVDRGLRGQLSAVIWSLVPNIVYYALLTFSRPFAKWIASDFVMARTLKRWADLVFLVALLGNSPVVPLAILRIRVWYLEAIHWRRGSAHKRPKK